MKKLMFSLAVAGLCGAVFANVESKNVVGYGPTTLPNSGLSVGPSFYSVSGEKIDLYDLTVTGYEETTVETYGDVVVQTLLAGGATDRTFTWYDYTDGDRIVGWFEITADGEYLPLEADDVVMGAGEGLWSSTSVTDLFFGWPKVDIK